MLIGGLIDCTGSGLEVTTGGETQLTGEQFGVDTGLMIRLFSHEVFTDEHWTLWFTIGSSIDDELLVFSGDCIGVCSIGWLTKFTGDMTGCWMSIAFGELAGETI